MVLNYKEIEISSPEFLELSSGTIKYTLLSDKSDNNPRTALLRSINEDHVNAYNMRGGTSAPFKIRVDNLKTFSHASASAANEQNKALVDVSDTSDGFNLRGRVKQLEDELQQLKAVVTILLGKADLGIA